MAVSDAEKRKFTKEITRLKSEHDCTFLEAIVQYCVARNIDPSKKSVIVKLINTSLKAKITAEAKGLHLIKRKPRRKSK